MRSQTMHARIWGALTGITKVNATPDAVRHERGLDRGVSNRLIPRAEGRVWQIYAKKGSNAFLIADAATGERAKQAVSGDNLVELVIEEMVDPIGQKANLVSDGVKGTVEKQAVDGRVLNNWVDETETWEDLAKFDFLWVQRRPCCVWSCWSAGVSTWAA